MNNTFNMSLGGTDYELVLTKNFYANNKNLYLGLFARNEGPFANITVNIDPLPLNQAAVNTNTNPWVEDFIVENKLGFYTGKKLKSGFCEYPIYEFDLDLIDELTQRSV